MAKSWKCPRCSTTNDTSSLNCTQCGFLQGGVYVPTAWDTADAPARPDGHAASSGTSEAPGAPEAPAAPADGAAWSDAEWRAGGEGAAAPVDDTLDRDLQPSSEAAPRTDADWGANHPASADETPGGAGATPYAGMEAPIPTAPVPLWRRIPIGWLVIGIVVLGGSISGWYFGAGRADTGEISKPGDLTATELRVGDCFDLKDPEAEEIGDVAAVPCTQEHEFELYYIGSMPDGSYPTDAAFEAFIDANCTPAFQSYVGKAYDESELDVYWLYPSPDGWTVGGDRSIQCAVYHPRVHRLTESLKGSEQ